MALHWWYRRSVCSTVEIEMTAADQSLADDKMRAEIAQLLATTAKLNAETSKIMSERFWLPFTVFGGVFAAVTAVVVRLIG